MLKIKRILAIIILIISIFKIIAMVAAIDIGAGAVDAAAVAEAAAAIAAGVAKLEIALGSESAQQRSILFGAAMELSEMANAVVVRMLGDGATASANTQRLLEQHMQNAVTIAFQAAQRGIAHADLAQDRQWNPDEVAAMTVGARQQAAPAS